MNKIKILCFSLFAALLLSGCSMNTVDKLYCLPRRSDRFSDLQTAIDKAMVGLEYSAPKSGENQQTVQVADLDGDGEYEYLVFAKGFTEAPLKILIFAQQENEFHHVDTIDSNGTDFESVEYVQMDGGSGSELVVGYQIANQVPKSVSVYTFPGRKAQLLLQTNYTKFLSADLDMDNYAELFVLRPGQTEADNGIGEIYGITSIGIERSNEVSMSGPVDRLKRILVGKLHDGQTAVYVASTVDDSALITDVFTCLEGNLVNVSFSNESGTSVQTLRNFFIYSDDIDNDGVVELPSLLPMKMMDATKSAERHDLIRWYAMDTQGSETDKLFTYHDFIAGWYLELPSELATRVTVEQVGNESIFYLWSENFDSVQKIFTIYSVTGKDRKRANPPQRHFVLLKGDPVTYMGCVEPGASQFGITDKTLIRNFHRIQQEWKTGEL